MTRGGCGMRDVPPGGLERQCPAGWMKTLHPRGGVPVRPSGRANRAISRPRRGFLPAAATIRPSGRANRTTSRPRRGFLPVAATIRPSGRVNRAISRPRRGFLPAAATIRPSGRANRTTSRPRRGFLPVAATVRPSGRANRAISRPRRGFLPAAATIRPGGRIERPRGLPPPSCHPVVPPPIVPPHRAAPSCRLYKARNLLDTWTGLKSPTISENIYSILYISRPEIYISLLRSPRAHTLPAPGLSHRGAVPSVPARYWLVSSSAGSVHAFTYFGLLV